MTGINNHPIVFISYSRDRDDYRFAKRLKHDLEQEGIDAWIDRDDAGPALDVHQAIQNALEEAICVIMVASPGTIQSFYVLNEIEFALTKRLPVYPVWAYGTSWRSSAPFLVSRAQFVDCRGISYKNGLRELIRQISVLPQVIEHRPDANATGSPSASNIQLAETPAPSDESESPFSPEDEDAWHQFLGELLPSQEAEEMVGQQYHNVEYLAEQGHLLAIRSSDGQLMFPAFQFKDMGHGRREPYGAILVVLHSFRQVFEDLDTANFMAASWLRSPQEELAGESPEHWLKHHGDHQKVINAAESAAIRFEH